MKQLISAFSEAGCIYSETQSTWVIRMQEMSSKEFDGYGAFLEDNGFTGKSSRSAGGRWFRAYQRGGSGVFLNYYEGNGEITAVFEENCPYFSFSDTPRNYNVSPQITQVHLEDFGMSYAIRLTDGRFLVIDGGRELIPDADRLMECLKEGSPESKPVIAAWIFSHPHPDHYYCFFPFLEQYREAVEIEKIFLNFPEADDLAHYPKLVSPRLRETGVTANAHMIRLREIIRNLDVPVYCPHTGQIYRIGDAVLEILASMDDTIGRSENVNASSLVIRMELGGQTTLWTTDASCEAAQLSERYGHYLKADILQVPHHGFGIGSPAATMAAYRLIAPKVCLLPVSDFNAFTTFCAYRECTQYLMTRCDVKELITGETTRTLTLPYTPDPQGAKRLKGQFLAGQENAGARTWVFTELNTANPEDFVFTVLNATHANAEILIELFFANGIKPIRFIEAAVLPLRIRRICITDSNDVDRDAAYYNPWSIEKNEIPPAVPFALRFMSNIPVVISHKDHRDSYHTFNCHL